MREYIHVWTERRRVSIYIMYIYREKEGCVVLSFRTCLRSELTRWKLDNVVAHVPRHISASNKFYSAKFALQRAIPLSRLPTLQTYSRVEKYIARLTRRNVAGENWLRRPISFIVHLAEVETCPGVQNRL